MEIREEVVKQIESDLAFKIVTAGVLSGCSAKEIHTALTNLYVTSVISVCAPCNDFYTAVTAELAKVQSMIPVRLEKEFVRTMIKDQSALK